MQKEQSVNELFAQTRSDSVYIASLIVENSSLRADIAALRAELTRMRVLNSSNNNENRDGNYDDHINSGSDDRN